MEIFKVDKMKNPYKLSWVYYPKTKYSWYIQEAIKAIRVSLFFNNYDK